MALMALAIGGCSETRLAALTAKAVGGSEGAGQYKVGDPYRLNGIWYYPAVDYNYDGTGIASWYGEAFEGKTTANGEVFRLNGLTAAHPTLPLPSMVRVTNLENGRALALRVNDRGPFASGRIIDVSRRAAQLLGFERQGTARVRVQIVVDESRALAAAGQGTAAQFAAADGGAAPEAAPRTTVSAVALDDSSAGLAVGTAATSESRTTAFVAPEPDGRVTQLPVRATNLYIQAGAFAERGNAARLQAKLKPFGRTGMAPVFVGGQRYYRVRLGPIATLSDADRVLAKVIGAGVIQAHIVVD
jgi:rare lipoprotein A